MHLNRKGKMLPEDKALPVVFKWNASALLFIFYIYIFFLVTQARYLSAQPWNLWLWPAWNLWPSPGAIRF